MCIRDRPQALLEKFLTPLLAQGVDTLVLGCTHYPFLTPLIQRLVPEDTVILDPSAAVARQLRRRLETTELLASAAQSGAAHYFTSGAPSHTAKIMSRLLGYPVSAEPLPTGF